MLEVFRYNLANKSKQLDHLFPCTENKVHREMDHKGVALV